MVSKTGSQTPARPHMSLMICRTCPFIQITKGKTNWLWVMVRVYLSLILAGPLHTLHLDLLSLLMCCMFHRFLLISFLCINSLKIIIVSSYLIHLASLYRTACPRGFFFRVAVRMGSIHFGTSSSLLQPTAPTVFFGERSSIDVWHKRLGHPSSSSLQHLLHDIPIRGTSSMSFCDHCQYGKSHKLPFPISPSVSSQPLEIVHSDVWGPSPVLSVNGFKYYLIFIDAHGSFL